METIQDQKIDEKKKGQKSSETGFSFRNTSISKKFTLLVCFLLTLTMCVFWLISNYNTQNILRQQADSLGQSLAAQTASQLTELILANDLISMNVILANLTTNSAIKEAYVINIDNELLASASSNELQVPLIIPLPVRLKNLQVEYSAPISLADSIAGFVRLRLDLRYIEAGLINNLIFIVGATGLMLIVSIAITTTYFKYLISFPSTLLSYYLSKIRNGEVEKCPEPSHQDELSLVIRQYNVTAEFLAQNTFLTNIAIKHPRTKNESYKTTSREQDTTLVRICLSNFEYLVSTLSEERTKNLLNNYYFYSGKVSQLYNGSVFHCSDDEVLISFNNEQSSDEHAFYAIRAAQLFLEVMRDTNDVLENATIAKYSLAVHSGNFLNGFYSPVTQRMNMLSGRTLDTLRAIAKECPENSVLLSISAFEHTGAGTRIDAEEFETSGEVEVKTFLASDPISDHRALLETQATQLIELYSN